VTSNLHTPKVLRNFPLMAVEATTNFQTSVTKPSHCTEFQARLRHYEESRYQIYSDVWYNPVLVVFKDHCHSCHSKLHSFSRRYKIVNKLKKQHVTVTELVNRKEFIRSSNILVVFSYIFTRLEERELRFKTINILSCFLKLFVLKCSS
jgi:hypothetical protein